MFEIARLDGRSDAQVVLEFVRDGTPGTLYRYAQFAEVLNAGATRDYDIKAIRGAVVRADMRLLREYQRTLVNVRNVGYRLALAGEHRGIATTRKRRADSQLKKGLTVLRNVKWDELGETERQAHQGMLMVTEALVQNQMAMDRRLRAVEDAIRKLS